MRRNSMYLFVTLLGLADAGLAHAEGSSNIGISQGLRSSTVMGVDIADPVNEVVRWRGLGNMRVFRPDGSLLGTASSGQAVSIAGGAPGAYLVRVDNGQPVGTVWEVTVERGGVAQPGRLFSQLWQFDAGGFTEEHATDASFYGRVPAGAPGVDSVIEFKFDGLAGFIFDVGGNQHGVEGIFAGRSVPQTGSQTVPDIPIYLAPPQLASYSALIPEVSDLGFQVGPRTTCNRIQPGLELGAFRFTSTVPGTYHLICDLDQDNTFDRTGGSDLLLVGQATAGANTIPWDGLHLGAAVVNGFYDCEIQVVTGEFHYMGVDIETSYEGLRMFQVNLDRSRTPLDMYWNDQLVQALDILMPNGEFGLAGPGPNGMNSGAYSAPAVPNRNARSWGHFVGAGKGNLAILDTYTWVEESDSAAVEVVATDCTDDEDGDGLNGCLEACTLGTSPGAVDSDGDGIDDFVETNGGSAVDTDGDDFIDALDPDSDGDSILDSVEGQSDIDGDGRPNWRDTDDDNDGIATLVELFTSFAFGHDIDGDGQDNWYDTDSDGDTVDDATDLARLDGSRCADADADRCDDCAVARRAQPGNDGDDHDADGACDAGDDDDDADTLSDSSEAAIGTDPFDGDCDDDGLLDGREPRASEDTDGDGAIDARDPDSDGDGIRDGTEAGVSTPAADTSLAAGQFVADADPTTTTSPVHADTDGGGVRDGVEDRNANGAIDAGESNPRDRSDDGDVDSDRDGIADLAEGPGDSDGDGLADAFDSDSDDDGVPDAIEAGDTDVRTPPVDTDGDGLPDFQDADSDDDTVSDGVDSDRRVPTRCADADGDSCDDCVVARAPRPSGDGPDHDSDGLCDTGDNDDDNDGLVDVQENISHTNPLDADSDDDGVVDGDEPDEGRDRDDDGLIEALDFDSDDDGIADGTELGVTAPARDTDLAAGHFVPDADPSTTTDALRADSDHGSVDDGAEDANASGAIDPGESDPNDPNDDRFTDSDGDGISNLDEGSADADADGIPNWRDLDSDGDTISDAQEAGDASIATPPEDTDRDGRPDYVDVDSDGDGLPDSAEAGDADITTPPVDTDRDGRPDCTDTDSDGDSVGDGQDSAPRDPTICIDSDRDTCNDCAVTSRAQPDNDGPDSDRDGLCDAGDLDDDDDRLDDAGERAAGTDPFDADSDDDGALDGDELEPATDSDHDGLINARDPDSDDDGLFDGTELGVTTPHQHTNLRRGAFTPDADPRTTTDPLAADSDRGGVPDGAEDPDHDGAMGPGELDPRSGDDDTSPADADGDGLTDAEEFHARTRPGDADSDDDGVLDGQEPNWAHDTDGNGLVNALDPDSDDDGIFDGTELGVTAADPDTDASAGFFRPDADPTTTTSAVSRDSDFGGLDDGAEDPDHDGRISAGELDPGQPGDDVAGALDSDGDGLTDIEEYTGCIAPRDADSDDDGVLDGQEPNWNLDMDRDGLVNAMDPDSDGDGILDGTELGVTAPPADTDPGAGAFVPDADPDTTTSAVNPDSDGGGAPDGFEDADHDGARDPGEGDPNQAADDGHDRDGDGVADWLEDQYGTGIDDADSDDDGVRDGLEPAWNRDVDGDGSIGALDPDADADQLSDGLELGVTQPGTGTDPARGHFVPDADPATTTDPLAADSDGGGVPDGIEDIDHDGALDLDAGETDPTTASDDDILDQDGDSIPDVVEGTGDDDGDGIPNARDTDADNDTILDIDEAGDHDRRTSPRDSDGDGAPDFRDRDSDGDTIFDAEEAGDADPRTPAADPDQDGIPSYIDADSDGDTILDTSEAGDSDLRTRPHDSDGDGTSDFLDLDADGDGALDADEAGDTSTSTSPVDSDGDHVPDYLDPDSDGDGVDDATDGCRMDRDAEQEDMDGDLVGDACDDDVDGDLVANTSDNCPTVENPMQEDQDLDGVGAACDDDEHSAGWDDTFGVSGGGCSATRTNDGSTLLLVLVLVSLLARLRMRSLLSVVIVTASALAANSARAQAVDTAFPVERFHLALDRDGILDVESGAVPRHLDWNLFAWMSTADDPLIVYRTMNDARVGALVSQRSAATLAGSLALFGRVQLGLELPVILHQSQDPGLAAMTGGLSSAGIGDARIVPKLQLLAARQAGIDLSLMTTLTVPTAAGEDFRGDRGVSFTPEVAVSRSLGALRLATNLGYRMRQDTQLANLAVGDELLARVAGAYRLGQPGGRFVDVALSLSGATSASEPLAAGNRDHLELVGGGSYGVTRSLMAIAAAGMGIREGFGSPDWRIVVGLRFSREPSRGEPRRRTLVIRLVPEPPAPEPALAIDTDGDGIHDERDACTSQAEDIDSFEDGDGCPDLDNDADQVADIDDACINAAGPAATSGCPDRDGDRIADTGDRCVEVAGIPALEGCPEPDRDGDTIIDRLDNCPEQAGTVAHGGCVEPQLAKIYGDRIEILEQVQFRTNRARIRQSSYELLRNVARVILAHPEITRVRVDGHTDDRGDDDANLVLSQRRAEAVVQFLIDQGVERSRLEPHGHGEQRPITDNQSRLGRAVNRRVEFHIVAP